MADASDRDQLAREKADRHAARELIAAYHQDQLRALLERVRARFAKLDAGEIDEFELGRPDPALEALRQRVVEVLRVDRL